MAEQVSFISLRLNLLSANFKILNIPLIIFSKPENLIFSLDLSCGTPVQEYLFINSRSNTNMIKNFQLAFFVFLSFCFFTNLWHVVNNVLKSVSFNRSSKSFSSCTEPIFEICLQFSLRIHPQCLTDGTCAFLPLKLSLRSLCPDRLRFNYECSYVIKRQHAVPNQVGRNLQQLSAVSPLLFVTDMHLFILFNFNDWFFQSGEMYIVECRKYSS